MLVKMNKSVKIISTNPKNADFHLFETLPNLLYKADEIRCKQAEIINGEFLDSCYVLLEDNEPKARMAIYNNPLLNYDGKSVACIGNYECVNDNEISAQLIHFACQAAKKLGKEFLIGPMNGSTWDNYRFSLHNNYPNFLFEPYHHLYYNQQFINSGFKTISTYVSNIDKEMPNDSVDVLELEKRAKKFGVKIRNINLSDYDNELEKLYPFITSSFKTNFLYTPISKESFIKKYQEARKIINSEYFLIAEDKEENTIGFIFCYEDMLNATAKSLIIKTLVRNKSKQWSGLGHILANRVIRLAKSNNYTSVVHAFMMEQGTSKKTSANFRGKNYKNYVLYGLHL
jgi:hypothetical protein